MMTLWDGVHPWRGEKKGRRRNRGERCGKETEGVEKRGVEWRWMRGRTVGGNVEACGATSLSACLLRRLIMRGELDDFHGSFFFFFFFLFRTVARMIYRPANRERTVRRAYDIIEKKDETRVEVNQLEALGRWNVRKRIAIRDQG